MDRLIFIDDDADELEVMRDLILNAYDYLGLHWPEQLPDRSTIHEPEPGDLRIRPLRPSV